MAMTMYNPAHPGEILREYLGDVQVGEAARRLRVARSTLSRLLNGRASFTAPMALRLAAAFGTEPNMWLDLQQQYDLWHAARRKQPKVEKFTPFEVRVLNRETIEAIEAGECGEVSHASNIAGMMAGLNSGD